MYFFIAWTRFACSMSEVFVLSTIYEERNWFNSDVLNNIDDISLNYTYT